MKVGALLLASLASVWAPVSSGGAQVPAGGSQVISGSAQGDHPVAEPVKRSRVIGRTVLAGGEAWADCEIQFFSRPLPDRVDLGKVDLVKVRSSSKGRFSAKLLPGRRYMAWARTIDEEGRHWFGQVVDRVTGGQVVKFVRAKVYRPTSKMIVKTGEPWKAMGPLSFHVRFGAHNMEIPLEAPDEKGNLTIPPLPWRKALILARTAGQEPLFVYEFTAAAIPLLPKVWRLDKPHPLKLEIQTKDGPVSGARVSALVYESYFRSVSSKPGETPSVYSVVHNQLPGFWVQLGKSNAEGHCDVLAHQQTGGSRSLKLRIEAEGMADRFHVISRFPAPKPNKKIEPEKAKEAAKERIQITLDKGVRTHGRILLADGKPAANLPFLVLRNHAIKSDNNSTTRVQVRSHVHRTKADGTFSFSALKGKTLYRIVTPLDEDLWVDLAPKYEDLRLPSPYLVLHQARCGTDATDDLGDLALDKMAAVELFIESARRDRDASSIAILKNVTEKASVLSTVATVLNFDFDVKGKASFLLPPGSYDTLILHSTRGSDQEPLALVERDRGKVLRRRVDFEPFHTILLSVQDSDGKPVPDATLSMGGGGYTHVSRLCSEIYAYNGRAISSLKTGEKGTARLRLITVKSQNYNCRAQTRKIRGNRANQVRIDTNNLPETLELEIGK